MTEKEKLVDLLKSADMRVFGEERPWAELVANYLLENGVTIPSCREEKILDRKVDIDLLKKAAEEYHGSANNFHLWALGSPDTEEGIGYEEMCTKWHANGDMITSIIECIEKEDKKGVLAYEEELRELLEDERDADSPYYIGLLAVAEWANN